MRVNFSRWKIETQPSGSRARNEYFRFHKTPNASMVNITAIHLEGDVIQCQEHRCKKGRLLVIEPIEDPKLEDIDLEYEEEEVEEEPQLAISILHALAGYANPQTMKIDRFLKHQLITILIDTESTNNCMDSKVACSLVKLVTRGQEITTNFYLMQLDDYEVVLSIKLLSTLGDVF
ncbi:hypothetical protein B296_00032138 [Ensete ventricosum]|uniref:Uncharacterized protein n=1 Tax=Ensete ventricosum TaxID=4639 RepID=A0A427AEK0_ENSVE|nr:hypothetical protein B296_00032138 [Ensete ventricosum]